MKKHRARPPAAAIRLPWRSARRWATGLVWLALGAGAQAGLFDGKYGAAQVFDVQRSPAFPVAGGSFAVFGMQDPFNSVAPPFPYQLTGGQYVQFFKVPGSPEAPDPCNVGINLYEADGTLNRVIAAGGTVYGLAAEGLLHTSVPTDFGTFVANNAGYATGDSISFTTPIGVATCAQAESYAANTTPLQTPGPAPVPVAAPVPIPTLSPWAILALSGLLGLGVAALRGRHGIASPGR